MKAARRRRIESRKSDARLRATHVAPTDAEWGAWILERDRTPIASSAVFPAAGLELGRSTAIREFMPANQGFSIERKGTK